MPRPPSRRAATATARRSFRQLRGAELSETSSSNVVEVGVSPRAHGHRKHSGKEHEMLSPISPMQPGDSEADETSAPAGVAPEDFSGRMLRCAVHLICGSGIVLVVLGAFQLVVSPQAQQQVSTLVGDGLSSLLTMLHLGSEDTALHLRTEQHSDSEWKGKRTSRSQNRVQHHTRSSPAAPLQPLAPPSPSVPPASPAAPPKAPSPPDLPPAQPPPPLLPPVQPPPPLCPPSPPAPPRTPPIPRAPPDPPPRPPAAPPPPLCTASLCSAAAPYECLQGPAKGGCAVLPWSSGPGDCDAFCKKSDAAGANASIVKPPVHHIPQRCDEAAAAAVAEALNKRFVEGGPSANLREAGVLVHMVENYDRFWLPNKARPDNYPCSLVNHRSPPHSDDGGIPVWGTDEPGVVLSPEVEPHVRCSFASDGNSQGRPKGCYAFITGRPGGGEPLWCQDAERWTMKPTLGPGCAWRPEKLQTMLEQHEEWALQYNEVVLDGPGYVASLPSAIDAVFYRSGFYGGVKRARSSFYQAFLDAFGDSAPPLLRFDRFNWNAPFSPAPCGYWE